MENNLLRLVRSPEFVEPVPPETADSIRQEAAEAEPDDGAERCVPADRFGGALEYLAVVCGQIMLKVRLGQLGQLVVLVVSTESCKGHLEAACEGVCVEWISRISDFRGHGSFSVKTDPADFKRLCFRLHRQSFIGAFRSSSSSFGDVLMTSRLLEEHLGGG